jgi:outer membrane surface antigen
MRNFTGLSAQLLGAAVLCALALWLLNPEETTAQLGRKNFEALPKLTKSDLTMIRKLVREELIKKPAGTSLPWSNPDSSNSGTVTLVSDFMSKSRHCWRVQYAITPGDKQPAAVKPGAYTLNNCQMPDGSWRIDSQARPDAKKP